MERKKAHTHQTIRVLIESQARKTSENKNVKINRNSDFYERNMFRDSTSYAHM